MKCNEELRNANTEGYTGEVDTHTVTLTVCPDVHTHMVDSTVRWLCTLPFSPSSVPSLPILQTPGGAGLAEVPTIDKEGPGVRSPCPFFLSPFKASLLSLPQPLSPLRSLVGLEARSKATPCPTGSEWPSGSQWHSSASWHTWPCTCLDDQRSRPPGGVSP